MSVYIYAWVCARAISVVEVVCVCVYIYIIYACVVGVCDTGLPQFFTPQRHIRGCARHGGRGGGGGGAQVWGRGSALGPVKPGRLKKKNKPGLGRRRLARCLGRWLTAPLAWCMWVLEAFSNVSALVHLQQMVTLRVLLKMRAWGHEIERLVHDILAPVGLRRVEAQGDVHRPPTFCRVVLVLKLEV